MAKLREIDVIYPQGGENRRGAYSGREAPFTSPYAENVRSFDSIERRGRGGSRPALKKWISDNMGASITAMEMLSYQGGSYVSEFANANEYNGTDEYTDLGNTFESTFQGSFTVGLWFRADDGQDDTVLVGVSETGLDDRFGIYTTPSGEITVLYKSNGNSATATTNVSQLDNGVNSWHHLCIIADSIVAGVGGLKIYLDADEIALDAGNDGDTSGVTFSDFASTKNLYLGALNNQGNPTLYFDGGIDGFKIYGEAKSEAWISADYATKNYALKEALVVIVDGAFKMVHGSTVTTSTAYLETEAGTVITNEAASSNLEANNSTVDAVNTVTDNGEYNVVQYNGKLYVAGDYCYKFSPNNGTVEAVENAPAGQPLVEVYRNRLLLGGSDHIFAMSEEGDFAKWNYYDIERGAVRAVAGTPTDDGKLGGDMTCFKSWGSSAVIMASKDTIWVIRGNPNTNGRLDNVSRELGIVDQGAISITGNGQVVFLARSGLFTWHVGSNSAPERFSDNIVPEELKDVDTTANIVKMQYDEKEHGIHLFVTPTAASVGTHWFLDLEAKAFWRSKYQQTHQPLDVAVMPVSGDSNVLLGSKDGYIRRHDYSATDDDGEDLSSHILIGAFRLGAQGGDMGQIQKIFASLANGSAGVTWAIVTGNSAEEAIDNAVTDIQAGTTTNVVSTGTWAANWNTPTYARTRGSYAVIWLSGASNWAYESMGFIKEILGSHKTI